MQLFHHLADPSITGRSLAERNPAFRLRYGDGQFRYTEHEWAQMIRLVRAAIEGRSVTLDSNLELECPCKSIA